jgi:hypothetical protein
MDETTHPDHEGGTLDAQPVTTKVIALRRPTSASA